MADRERIGRLLGGEMLDSLRARLRSIYERGSAGGVVTLSRLADHERVALCGLLGRPLTRGASMSVDLDVIDGVLYDSGAADSLREALELLDGPIVDRMAERKAAAQEWDRLLDKVAAPRLAAWLEQSRSLGLLKRLAGGQVHRAGILCEQAETVLAALPCTPMARSQLAAQLLGDAHALDPARPVATLVMAVLRHRRAGGDSETAVEQEEESERATWAASGVLVNELARPALFLNLPGYGVPGDPSYLSLRSLMRTDRYWPVAGRTIFICENPNIVAIAADVLRTGCAPLVCTDGMPAAAQRTLLSQLRRAGACLRYHGDFDWPGIDIGNVMMRSFGAQPWRFTAPDYDKAVRTCTPTERRLVQSRREAEWDPLLGRAMRTVCQPIDEEAVAAELLDDLNAGDEHR
jgi:uncharacterized protein (TIGR02679 family)